jgi:hypothetical protein
LGGTNMRLRGMHLALLVLTLLASVLTAAQADVIARDVAYWYWREPDILDTWFNPDSQWLREHRSKLVIKVQQTVYDERQTAAILGANAPKPSLRARALRSSLKADVSESTQLPEIPKGFLFSYAVTNLNWRQPMGMTAFAVDWGSVPVLLCTTSRTQTPLSWTAKVASTAAGDPVNGPAWLWRPANPARPGLRIGSTVGGFWAVSPTGTDGVVNAWTGSAGTGAVGLTWILSGKTTGPIPEPTTAATLVVAVAALGVFRPRRRAS